MSARKLAPTALVSLCLTIGALCSLGGTAQALVFHRALKQITEFPDGPGTVLGSLPQGVHGLALDRGNLWFDVEGYRTSAIFEYSAAGELGREVSTSQFEYGIRGLALDDATEDLYATTLGAAHGAYVGGVAVYDASGGLLGVWDGAKTPSGSFEGVPGESPPIGSVAVDNSTDFLTDWAAGDVYVANLKENAIDVFKSAAGGEEGEYETKIEGVGPGEPFTNIEGFALDQANGYVAVIDGPPEGTEGPSVVDIFEPTAPKTYRLVRRLTETPQGPLSRADGVTFDGGAGEGSGDLFVVEGPPSGERIAEFNAEGSYVGQISPEGAASEGFELGTPKDLVVDPETHDLYVTGYRPGDEAHRVAVFAFGPDVVLPDVVTGGASGVVAVAGVLHGTVDPLGAGGATCRFEWGTSPSFGKSAPCSTEVANGRGAVGVEAMLGGLQPDTTYYYRLQASNSNGTNGGEPSQDQHFTTLGPGVGAASSVNVASTSATLAGEADPHGRQATYYFQYGPTSGYGATAPILSGASPNGQALGSADGHQQFAQHLQGLQPASVYHYRLVVTGDVEVSPGTSELETFYSADQTFTTQAGAGESSLPDGRSWEMVTPPSKFGALIFPLGTPLLEALNVQASSDGRWIMYMANAPTEASPQGYDNGASEIATRGPSGWSSQAISPPHHEGTGPTIGAGVEYRFFSEDLSLGLVQVMGNFDPLSPLASEQTPYLRTVHEQGEVSAPCSSSCYEPLVTASDSAGVSFGGTSPAGVCGGIFCGPEFVGATGDLSHVLLRSGQLTSTPIEEKGNGLYEWSAGRLQLVSSLPPGETGPAGQRAVAGELGDEFNRGVWQHAVADDGSRVIWYFNSEPASGDLTRRHLYLWDEADGESVRIDVPQTEGGVSSNPVFSAASGDLSKVFFTDGGRLTAGSNATPGKPDLYEYSLAAPAGRRLTDLTPGEGEGGVDGVMGLSEDGSYVYYLRGANLFEYHEGATTHIAELDPSVPILPLYQRPLRVSPNGRWLAFQSPFELTGYDTSDAVSGQLDEEVYLYNGETHKLVCASCNPTGARPAGRQLDSFSAADADAVWAGRWVSAVVPTWTRFNLVEARYQSRYLSDSGRLFFDSNEALVPQDVNGTMDVYEYEQPGEGSCTVASETFSERSGGCVGLISSGTAAQESSFMDASESGGDVFFLTSAPLLPQDVDTAYDVYDAHRCTGDAACYAAAPVAPPMCDNGESCKAAETPQPSIFGSPSSETFSGAGNSAAPSEPPGGGASHRRRHATRAQKLAKALSACRKRHGHHARAVCERRAKGRYRASGAASRVGVSVHYGSRASGH